MMFKLTLITFFIVALQLNLMSAQELKAYKWEKRILFILDSENDPEKKSLQLNKFKARSNEMKERDLILFVYNGKHVLDINGSLSNIKIEEVPFNEHHGVILIGKDGGVKLRQKFIVEAKEVFELIDQMPMRRAEMKNK